ncbi:PhzF family phenazine biosynthesis protein [Halarchaeum sp. CBA1220]|uniref:PhzF family phenazine biosynthesis protein n=1 Tax=Halarchaeum sp. CBA1220 TaxID=1853682 RepID=UPI000F3AA7CE|nr:PhzF family phenazine biosynthesis protein [Halarchaeum sp. CBA1220]QLC33813.1 PhzF family phenazine biosynthesis protein [Halarchaeum sp. CBA1220]
MHTTRALLCDAFTDRPLTGNAAGVVPDADELSDAQMQAVARELAVSETAFVTDSDDADRRLRYFTPTTEVDLCGHATVATHAHLHEAGVLEAGTHTVETTVGVLDVELTDDGVVWMTQRDPSVRRLPNLEEESVADALGIEAMSFVDELPLAVADTGLPFLVVGLDYLSTLGEVDPEDAAIRDLCQRVGAKGVYAFTFDTLEREASLHGRAFCAPVGIHEDPVTGTASGAVGAYLDEVAAFGTDFPDELVCEQGHYVERPGEVRVRVDDDVRVGGTAATALDGELTVPPEEDDDEILEA